MATDRKKARISKDIIAWVISNNNKKAIKTSICLSIKRSGSLYYFLAKQLNAFSYGSCL